MKNLLLMLIVLSLPVSFTSAERAENQTIVFDDYEEGWEDGYCEGWRDVKGQFAICPITPICPIPTLNCMEGYRCGYNRGFKAGMKAAKDD